MLPDDLEDDEDPCAGGPGGDDPEGNSGSDVIEKLVAVASRKSQAAKYLKMTKDPETTLTEEAAFASAIQIGNGDPNSQANRVREAFRRVQEQAAKQHLTQARGMIR